MSVPRYEERTRIRNRPVCEIQSIEDAFDVERGQIIIARDLFKKVVPDFLVTNLEVRERLAMISGASADMDGSTVVIKPHWEKTPRGGRFVYGGCVEITRKGRRITILDPIGFLHGPGGAEEFAAVIAELHRIGEAVELNLLPKQKNYSSLTRIVPSLLTTEMVRRAPSPIGLLADQSASGPYMRCVAMGHTDETLWYYDINAAYLVGLRHFFPELTDKLWEAGKICRGGQAKTIIKVVRSTIIGMMMSPGNSFYRPDIAKACYGVTRRQLLDLLQRCDDIDGTEVRSHTDGTILDVDLDVDEGDERGQWKKHRIDSFTLVGLNTWWAHPVRNCDGLLKPTNVTETEMLQALADSDWKPITIDRGKRFSYRQGDWIDDEFILKFAHNRNRCFACQAGKGPAQDLHRIRQPWWDEEY